MWHLVVELQGHVTVTKNKPRKRRVEQYRKRKKYVWYLDMFDVISHW